LNLIEVILAQGSQLSDGTFSSPGAPRPASRPAITLKVTSWHIHLKPVFKQKPTIPSVEWSLFAIFFIALQRVCPERRKPSAADASLKPVTVSERTAAPQADVTGFADIPLARSPFAATVVNSQTIEEIGALRLSDLFTLDASLSDAYNAVGYWDFVTIRGFVIDQTYNYRRDGLPISAETSIALENKERVEFLKGTSGIQAGTSAPGGLVNFVVKRPTSMTCAPCAWRPPAMAGCWASGTGRPSWRGPPFRLPPQRRGGGRPELRAGRQRQAATAGAGHGLACFA
jgi:hypothetical protein